MFVNEVHNFYVMVKIGEAKNAPTGYVEKKGAIFNQILSHIGAEKVADFDNVWHLKNVMYSSSGDVLDIISNEMIRLVAEDNSIKDDDKKLYELSATSDKVVVSEFSADNTSCVK